MLQWNSLGQLTGVYTTGAGWVYYGYDGTGRRVRRTAPNGSVTRYVYDGDDLAWEMDGAGDLLREYTYYPGVDQPYAVRVGGQGGQEYYYSTDHIGNVLGLVRGDGTLANAYTYTPWGETLTANEAVAQPLRYAARELDPVTGMYYVRARWYDPHQGRFVSEDPIGIEGGINLYSYAANSPTNMTDPSGLCPQWALVPVDKNKDGKVDSYKCVNGGNAIRLDGVSNGGESGRSLMSVIASAARAVGSLVGASGAGTIRNPAEPKPRAVDVALECGADVLGLRDLVDLGLVASGQAIPGTKRFRTPGTSRGTSLAGMAANGVFGDMELPFRMPTLSGGLGTGRRLAVTGTKKVARFAGRAVPVVGWALLAADAVQFGMCVADQY